MRIEVYNMRVMVLRAKEEFIVPLCFEVGETDLDRKKLADKIRHELDQKLGQNEYKTIGYTSRIIRPREN